MVWQRIQAKADPEQGNRAGGRGKGPMAGRQGSGNVPVKSAYPCKSLHFLSNVLLQTDRPWPCAHHFSLPRGSVKFGALLSFHFL